MQNFHISSPSLLTLCKGYLSRDQIQVLIETALSSGTSNDLKLLFALPYDHLKTLSAESYPEQIALGAAGMRSIDPGSFTEAIALRMLIEAKSNFTLLGTSLSRHLLGETDDSINKKIQHLLTSKIAPILCIGETAEQKEQGKSTHILTEQLKNGLAGISPDQFNRITIVYEAPWLDKWPTLITAKNWKKECENCHQVIKKAVGRERVDQLSILYACPQEIDDIDTMVRESTGDGFFLQSCEQLAPIVEAYHQIPIPTLGASFSAEAAAEPLDAPETEHSPAPASETAETAPRSEAGVTPPDTHSDPTAALTEPSPEAAAMPPKETSPEPAATDSSQTAPETFDMPLVERLDTLETDPSLDPLPLAASAAPSLQEEIEAHQVDPENSSPPFSQEEAEAEIATLSGLEKTVAEVYGKMQTYTQRIEELREIYPKELEKVLAALEQLPEELAEPMREGNLEFFQNDPEKFERARPAFELIQSVNEMIMEAGAIPAKIDRLQGPAKEHRRQLQVAWDNLHSKLQAIKKAYPEVILPEQPKLLTTPPPVIDLGGAIAEGPSPLRNKRIGMVKRDKNPP